MTSDPSEQSPNPLWEISTWDDEKDKLGKKIKVVCLIGLNILLIVSIISYWGKVERLDTFENEDTALSILAKLDGLAIAMTQIDTSAYHYIMMGDARHLKSYYVAIDSVNQIVKDLWYFTGKIAPQQYRIAPLDILLASKFTALRKMIDMRSSGGAEASIRMFATGRDVGTSDRFYAIIDGMRKKTWALMKEQHEKTEENINQTMMIAISGMCLVFVIIALMGSMLHQDIKSRNRVEQTLKSMRDELENLVQERTVALVQANKELQTEIVGRMRMEKELQQRVTELERFNHVAVGREIKMIELKKRIRELEAAAASHV